MGRLAEGERERRKQTIWQRLFGGFGLREQEIAQETGFKRRTVNNYLRELNEEGKAYRNGWEWYSDGQQEKKQSKKQYWE